MADGWTFEDLPTPPSKPGQAPDPEPPVPSD